MPTKMNDYSIILATNIKLFRARKNLTLTDLQRLTGISTATLSAIENGKKKTRMQTLSQIAKALNVSVDDLIIERKESKEND